MQLPKSALVGSLFRNTEMSWMIAAINEQGAGVRRLMTDIHTSPLACLMREIGAQARGVRAVIHAVGPENEK